jgi:hypothetical protein
MITDILNSNEYANILDSIVLQSGIEIYSSYPDTIAEIDQIRLTESGISEEQIIKFLSEESILIQKFNLAKLWYFNAIKTIEEYNPDFPPEKDNEVILKQHGFMKSFLLFNLIEYILLKKTDDSINNYLAFVRIPNKKKYIKQLRIILSKIGN